LDDIAEMLGQIDQEAEVDVEEMEREAQAITEGEMRTTDGAAGDGIDEPEPE